MATHKFFPTLVYEARLSHGRWRPFNDRLLRECRQLRIEDEAGRAWSTENYPGGYTSYSSVGRMHRISPTFAEFFKYEGAVIQSGNYEISESPLKISVEATERLAQEAREDGINSEFPTFVSKLFQKAAAAGHGDEEVAALIKVFRS